MLNRTVKDKEIIYRGITWCDKSYDKFIDLCREASRDKDCKHTNIEGYKRVKVKIVFVTKLE